MKNLKEYEAHISHILKALKDTDTIKQSGARNRYTIKNGGTTTFTVHKGQITYNREAFKQSSPLEQYHFKKGIDTIKKELIPF